MPVFCQLSRFVFRLGNVDFQDMAMQEHTQEKHNGILRGTCQTAIGARIQKRTHRAGSHDSVVGSGPFRSLWGLARHITGQIINGFLFFALLPKVADPAKGGKGKKS